MASVVRVDGNNVFIIFIEDNDNEVLLDITL
jgi:hypothetical protein